MKISRLAHADFSASAAASSSCNFFKEGGGLTTMLFFHCRSNFLDNLLLIPSSSSLSRLTVSIRAILLRMRPNSLDLNSLRADFCRRSMRSSPLRSTTSSLISSVVLVLISFISSNRFDIITTDDDGENETLWGGTRMCVWILTPLNAEDDEDLGIGMWGFGEKMMVEGEAIERLNIFCCCFFLG